MPSTRLERHHRKQTTKNILIIGLVVAVGLMLLLGGIPAFINLSSSLGSMFSRNQTDESNANIEFENLKITDIPDATNSARIRVAGVAVNLDEVDIMLNKEKVKTFTPKEGGFDEEIGDLQPGNNEVYLRGHDKNSDRPRVSTRYTVSYDTSKPELDIVSPSDGAKTPRDEITITGKTNVSQDASVYVNGSPVVTDPDGNFTTSVRLKEGENKIKATVTDSAGNTQDKEITVIYEK